MCEDCKKKEYTSFLAYQSSNPDKEVMELVFECVGELVIKLKEKNTTLYTVIQEGVPHGCGGPGQPKCN